MLVLVLPFPSQATPGVVLSFWIVTMTPFLSSIASFLLPMLDLMPREVTCWKDTCMIACIFGKTSFALGRGCQIVLSENRVPLSPMFHNCAIISWSYPISPRPVATFSLFSCFVCKLHPHDRHWKTTRDEVLHIADSIYMHLYII